MRYCCEKMEKRDQELIDYCLGNLVTIDSDGKAYPINHCPWCGTKFENPTLDRLDEAVEELKSDSLSKQNRQTEDKA